MKIKLITLTCFLLSVYACTDKKDSKSTTATMEPEKIIAIEKENNELQNLDADINKEIEELDNLLKDLEK
jgi:uncharacterized protein YlxW (UPF0749 family)